MNLNYSPSDDAFRADVSLARELPDNVLHHQRLNRDDHASRHRLLAAHHRVRFASSPTSTETEGNPA
ncbi:acyl-CoA dehydrogenase domain-containing protein [Caballeronia temeraria]|uniref:Acyl-CoA dehydrogenase domain-containing protein n=1 Tax=Caballeronia temeraria TaxID=1777137 RepID=A0A158BKI8_9BURK|nr:acyl-CoA dehydrogenase domain-containing protein [Caballeronia temeraria]